ncbi:MULTISPECIES: phage tail protein [Xanthomonas]|uniref:Microcystin-dependent protein n=3 Tax=Xanthomonas phaseoli TaxID=1985254 RepID=A0AB34QDW1_XANCH|nr:MULTISPECIES: tail fiber protein [Xanthomonas]ATS23199.1 phage tail protein [Xanthomonas phaseoli pv. phaseoli]ATS26096.1 phage tail protein [Xanthomonas phaseoli pv. phaseoli]ATS30413.1 phage tail protein [Xanthomonas phaseoli pv. phaseoli]ATS34354.1 phage tail protein [Xanthomonas phaseoli pv. phaseoli]AZU15371.1 microcystin-dependent protein [Xanthomonas phaseoli pv. phaseoli]
MSEFFVGQIMLTGFAFAPKFFAQCNGQLLPINQNQALFSLLNTRYGGDGRTTFGLPDLRGRTPIGYSPSVDPAWQPPAVPMGQAAGAETVTLVGDNLPAHLHLMDCSSANGDNRVPTGRLFANNVVSPGPGTPHPLYAAPGTMVPLAQSTIANSGGGQAHPNLQPYTTLNFCIALSGIFPSRN